MSAYSVELSNASPATEGVVLQFKHKGGGNGPSFYLSREEAIALSSELMSYLFTTEPPTSEFAAVVSEDPRDPRPGDTSPNVGYVRHMTGRDPVVVGA